MPTYDQDHAVLFLVDYQLNVYIVDDASVPQLRGGTVLSAGHATHDQLIHTIVIKTLPRGFHLTVSFASHCPHSCDLLLTWAVLTVCLMQVSLAQNELQAGNFTVVPLWRGARRFLSTIIYRIFVDRVYHW